jgi:hypothetical protein
MMLHAKKRTAEKGGNAENKTKRPEVESLNEQRTHPSSG